MMTNQAGFASGTPRMTNRSCKPSRSSNCSLFSYRFKSRLAIAFVNRNIAISERSPGHHVERTALGCMLLTPPTPLHDFGSLIFSDNALDLQQEVIFRALAERPVQENHLDASPAPFVEQ
jgi:hypothetical protein